MSNIYSQQCCCRKVLIKANELGNDTIDNIIKNKIKMSIGNKCINEGFVNMNSIEIIQRSIGKIPAIQFNGDINYSVEFIADICNPSKGTLIECTVKNINKMGIMADNGPLNIVIAKQHHVNNSNFDNIQIGEKINITIIGTRFELNDKEITVVGKLE